MALAQKAGGGVNLPGPTYKAPSLKIGDFAHFEVDLIAAVHDAMFLVPIMGLQFVTIKADPDQSLKSVQGRIVELELDSTTLPAPKPKFPEPKNEA